jgi:phage antirepressor YoqD-like protein
MSKGYTISFYLRELSNSSSSTTFRNVNDVYTFISPRKGKSSVKAKQLNAWLNGKTQSVLTNSKFGKTPRQRLINALIARKESVSA